MTTTKKTAASYSPEVRERAVRLVPDGGDDDSRPRLHPFGQALEWGVQHRRRRDATLVGQPHARGVSPAATGRTPAPAW